MEPQRKRLNPVEVTVAVEGVAKVSLIPGVDQGISLRCLLEVANRVASDADVDKFTAGVLCRHLQ